MAKRKILFLIPSLAGGGAERTLINLLQRIDHGRYEVDLVAVLGQGPYKDQVPSQVRFMSLFNNEFLVRTLAYLQKKMGFDQLFKWAVKRKVKRSYDVSISFLDSNFTDLLFLMPPAGKRYSWVHSSYRSYDNFYRYYKDETYRNKLIRDRYSKLDGIYFVSDDARKEFIEIFGTFPVMEVVYNMIDRDMVLRKSDEPVSFDRSVFSFVTVGSLFPVKGYDRLIRAAKMLADKGHAFRVHIFGKGTEEQSLSALASRLGLDDTVIFHGFVSNPYPYMKAGDVFVMSSVSEALPTVLCEAMILGKPVLVTNCSGCRELVGMGEYGLMSTQDDADLADKMEAYLLNRHLLTSNAGKSLERSGIFDTEKVMTKYNSIFNS
jgi:glycosyltransferase involved in cell wall biosynthesis